MDYLVFRLYGPLASWGEIAVGGERRSATHPGRSAIIGLLAAAAGIDRHDTVRQMKMSESYGVAVKLISAGGILKDYHTAQTPKAERKVVHHTRKSELSVPAGRLNTVLSSREYRTDALAVVAVWVKDDDPLFSLDELEHYLKEPTYHLYLGRKSCPLAVPLEPQKQQGETLRSVFDNALFSPLICNMPDSAWAEKRETSFFHREDSCYFWEKHPAPGMAETQIVERYDQPISRIQWQFVPRQEFMMIDAVERGDV
jgi:CRISPR system Cascade subunit CasD